MEVKFSADCIAKNLKMQYITAALINGRSAQVLVDTGANVVAINALQATALGLDYRQGRPATVITASGEVAAYAVNLASVEIGGIQVRNVEATVIEGAYPPMVLLGMSYLQHVEIRENDGILMLVQKY